MAAKKNNTYPRIWNVVAAIPPGRVASYGQVAKLAGLGRGARMVGWALGQAPDRAALPWHRVLNAQGSISIPKGSRSRAEQIRKLGEEGVVVIDGKVDMRRFRWEPDIDELVWGPIAFGEGLQE
jgi:methylated-DNA-protein-cysteine methyltransferase-like protein